MRQVSIALTLTVFLSLLSLAQQPVSDPSQQSKDTVRPAEDDVVRITTNLVQVDAVITDPKGKVVSDLRPEEMRILENGKEQKITHFSFVSLADPAAGAEPAAETDKSAPPVPTQVLRPDQVKRTMALVVDDLGLSFESAHYVRTALKKFVAEQLLPGDLVAIIRTAGGIGALQQFTSDKRQLFAAAERVKWNPTGQGGIGAFGLIGNSSSGFDRDAEDIDDFREEIFAVGTLGALNYVIRGMELLPGRKSLLLFSDGLRIFNRSDPTRSDRILTALRAVTDRANRAAVVIYTMDARGLITLGHTAVDSLVAGSEALEQQLFRRRTDFFDSQSGLYYLAERTGGFAIKNTNDLAGGILRVVEDQKSYYLIGYRPDESTFELDSGRRKFHRLGLKVLRPGKFEVRVRTGFYGVSDDRVTAAPATPLQRIYDALTSPFGSADLHLRLTSMYVNFPKVGSSLRSMLHVQARDLSFTENAGNYQAIFDLLIVAYGDNGRIVDQIARTQTITFNAEDYQRVMRHGYVYNVQMPIKKAGAYQLRCAVRDRGSERIGSATQFVEVPDIKKKKVTLSGMIVRGTSRASFATLYNQEPQANSSDGSVEHWTPEANPALREFKRGMVLVYGLEIYNAQLDKLSGLPKLQYQTRVFRNGRLLFSGTQQPVDTSSQKDFARLPLIGALQLGTDLIPGEYVFQVVISDLLASEKNRFATQWTGFEITK